MSTLRYSVYCISAETTTPSVYYFSPADSGYSIDNLAPDAPEGLEGEYLGGTQAMLEWEANSEHDLSHYAIYRGPSEDFVPSETNRIGTTGETCFIDEAYDPYGVTYYKVSALDVHENESGHAMLGPEDMAGTLGEERHFDTLLLQNVPNPFIGCTQIGFSVGRAGRVRLRIYDVTGRLVRDVLDEEREPRYYVERWDGLDGSGRTVSPGIYIYRLEVGDWSGVKKMLLAR
jgi:hypothetical protein